MTRFKSRMGLRGVAWLTSHRAASVVGVRVEPRVQRAPGVNVIGAGSNVGCITAHDNARARARARSQRCTFAHTCLPAHSPKTRHTASHGLLLSQAKPSQAKPSQPMPMPMPRPLCGFGFGLHAAGGMAVAVADCDYPSMTPMHSVCASSATPSEAAAAATDRPIAQ
jgi:hypothetical protein